MKLAAAAVFILAAGLVIMGATDMGIARSYLIRQADSQLKAYSDALVNGVTTIMPNGGVRSGPGSGPFGESGPAVEVLGPGGTALAPVGQRPIPVSPERPPQTSARAGTPFSVQVGNGRTTWRVISARIHYRAAHIPFVFGSQDTSVSVTSPAKPGLPGVLVVGVKPGSSLGGFTSAVLIVAIVAVVLVGWGVFMVTRASLARSVNTTLAQAERSLRASAASAAASQQSAERMGQALTDACLQARTPLRVIHGLAVSWRRRGGVRPGELDRVMRRIDEEATRIAALADHLARHDGQASPADGRPHRGGAGA